MTYRVLTSRNFLHDLKTCKKRGYDIDKLWNVIGKLQNGETLFILTENNYTEKD